MFFILKSMFFTSMLTTVYALTCYTVINSHRHAKHDFFWVMNHTLLQKYQIYSSKKKLLPVVDFGRS